MRQSQTGCIIPGCSIAKFSYRLCPGNEFLVLGHLWLQVTETQLQPKADLTGLSGSRPHRRRGPRKASGPPPPGALLRLAALSGGLSPRATSSCPLVQRGSPKGSGDRRGLGPAGAHRGPACTAASGPAAAQHQSSLQLTSLTTCLPHLVCPTATAVSRKCRQSCP